MLNNIGTFKYLIRENSPISADYSIDNVLAIPANYGFVEDGDVIEAIALYQGSVESVYKDLIIANLEEVAVKSERGFFSDLIEKAKGAVTAIFDKAKMKFFTKPQIVEVPDTSLYDILDKLESDRLTTINELRDSKIAGNLNTKDWANATAAELKILHTQAYTLGLGGLNNLNVFDKARLDKMLVEEFTYFSNLAKELSDGKLSQAQFKNRLEMYSAKARGFYEEARFRTAIANNYLVERRIRRAIESCQPCLDYASKGWVVIGSLPNPTFDCDCKSRCKCQKEYSKDLNLLNA